MEQHKNGTYHFQLCVLLNKFQHWLRASNSIKERHGIVLSFSGHDGYHSLYMYITQQYKGYIASGNHPEKIDFDISNLIVKRKLPFRIDLLALANFALHMGDKGLYEFLSKRGDKKAIDSAISA